MPRLCKKSGCVVLLSLVLLGTVTASAFSAPIVIDLSALGAVDSQITSGGQTFFDIGTTLGEPSLTGVDLTVTATGGFTSDPGGYGINEASVTFLFSTPVRAKFAGGGSLVPGETDSFGPTAQGSLTSTHIEPGLVVTDDSVGNPTVDHIITNQIVWESSVPGASWTHSVSGGNQLTSIAVVPEPSTIFLLAYGLLVGLGLATRRR